MLDETIEELRTVALDADDASGYFPAMYARVTDRIRTEVSTDRFANPDAMATFARAFAAWYLRPRAGLAPVPRCWSSAQDVAGDGRLLIVQHLLLGINAHVNHDLPRVVVELAEDRDDLHGLRPDFDAINDVLADMLPEVLRDLGRVSRWVNLAAARGGDRVFNFSLEVGRAQAWRSAERLNRLDPASRATDVAELDRMVSVLAYLITKPVKPFSWLVPLARRLEQDDPKRVTVSLLGHLS